MSLEVFKNRLESLGCIIIEAEGTLNVDVDENKI